jgi:hypothetical protein
MHGAAKQAKHGDQPARGPGQGNRFHGAVLRSGESACRRSLARTVLRKAQAIDRVVLSPGDESAATFPISRHVMNNGRLDVHK